MADFRPLTINASAGNLIVPLSKYLHAASATACFMIRSSAGASPAIFVRKVSDISVRNCQNCSNEIAALISKFSRRSITFLAPAFPRIPASLPGTAKRNASGALGSSRGDSTNRSITSVTVEKKGLTSFGPQTTNETYPSSRITLNASRTAATGSTKNIADNLPTATSNVRSANGRSSAEHCLKWRFVRARLPASA